MTDGIVFYITYVHYKISMAIGRGRVLLYLKIRYQQLFVSPCMAHKRSYVLFWKFFDMICDDLCC